MGRSDFPEGETVPHREVISKEKEERRKGEGESWSVGISRELENVEANFLLLLYFHFLPFSV